MVETWPRRVMTLPRGSSFLEASIACCTSRATAPRSRAIHAAEYVNGRPNVEAIHHRRRLAPRNGLPHLREFDSGQSCFPRTGRFMSASRRADIILGHHRIELIGDASSWDRPRNWGSLAESLTGHPARCLRRSVRSVPEWKPSFGPRLCRVAECRSVPGS